jgi:aspartyl-tRNA(Asn)/glutamyl-tRNA(Gln) amidotransferase subunit B
MSPAYTTIIGLEVHVQLSTASKLFCSCSTKFGAEPNTQTCPVCIGLPGSLPVMNREAYRLALKTAVALKCEIPPLTKWDRKQYYYPDLPKGYQISQYDLPMSSNGHLEISDPKGRFEPKRVRIRRAHLEEDAGKSLHDEIAGKGDSLIDLNRTGTPLLEIVTEPDLRSSAEAKAFLAELKLLLTYIGASDCNMQEGSLRVDANVNLHIADSSRPGSGDSSKRSPIATPIVEIKNMNSFRAVERALDYEAQRQFTVWQETAQKLGDVPKQTRGWDDGAGVTRGQRSKEESSDYRYFPDPDLVPVTASSSEIESARASLGELPATLRQRLETDFSLSAYDADVLVNQGRGLVEYFLDVARRGNSAKLAANWVTQGVLRILNDRPELAIETFPVSSETLGAMIDSIQQGAIPSSRAPDVFARLVETGSNDVMGALALLGIEQVDESELVALCERLLAANPKTLADVRAGKTQAIGALIGQAKKQNPNADPARVREISLQLIQGMKD